MKLFLDLTLISLILTGLSAVAPAHAHHAGEHTEAQSNCKLK